MITPYVGLKFYTNTKLRGGTSEPLLCEVVEIRDDEIVRYRPVVDPDNFVGEVHVNFFDRAVVGLPS